VLLLINEFDKRFLAPKILNVIGIIYSQYWLWPNIKQMFRGHVVLVKAQYHQPMEVSEDDVMCLVLLNGLKLY
jgi:hypothetical protein